MSCTDTAHRVKCRPSPGSCKDHIGHVGPGRNMRDRQGKKGTCGTSGTTQDHAGPCGTLHLAASSYPVPGRTHHLAPAAQQAAGNKSPSLTMAGHSFPSGHRSPLLTLARVPSALPTKDPTEQHRAQLPTCSAGKLSLKARSRKKNPPI